MRWAAQSPQAPAGTVAAQSSQLDAGRVAGLWSTQAPVQEAQDPGVAQRYQLLGVVFRSDRSWVSLGVQGEPARVLPQGAEIEPGLVISQVQPRSVQLSRGGVLVAELSLPEPSGVNTGQLPPPNTVALPPPAALPPAMGTPQATQALQAAQNMQVGPVAQPAPQVPAGQGVPAQAPAAAQQSAQQSAPAQNARGDRAR